MKSHLSLILCGLCLLAGAPDGWAKKNSPPEPAPPPPAAEAQPEKSRGFFGWFRSKQEPPPPASVPASGPRKSKLPPPPTTEEPKKSPGFFGFLRREKSEPTPPPPVTAKPGKKSAPPPAKIAAKTEAAPPTSEKKESSGFFGFFKRSTKPQESHQPDKPEADGPAKKPGFFARIFGGSSDSKPEQSALDDLNPHDRPQRPANWKEKYIVIEDDVAAYAYGPSQAHDPEDHLPKGMVVSVKRSGKFWTEITTPTGRNFTIGSDQIRKARETDFAPPPVIASSLPAGEIIPMQDFDPSPPPNLPETTPQRNLDLPDLILPPLPPP